MDDNIRKKLKLLGLPLTRKQFVLGDFIVHTIPAILTTYTLIKKNKSIPIVSLTYALTLSTWFVFSQVGKLDASDIYVPHAWKRGWVSVIIGMLVSPHLVNSIQHRKKYKLLFIILIMTLPYLSTKLDRDLQNKYKIYYKVKPSHKRLMKSTSTPILSTNS